VKCRHVIVAYGLTVIAKQTKRVGLNLFICFTDTPPLEFSELIYKKKRQKFNILLLLPSMPDARMPSLVRQR